MSDIDFWNSEAPYVDDGEDLNYSPLPGTYLKNGDLFLNVGFHFLADTQVQLVITEFVKPTDNMISVQNTDGVIELNLGETLMATLIAVGDRGPRERVQIVSNDQNELIVLRGQEGTSPQYFPYGSVMEFA